MYVFIIVHADRIELCWDDGRRATETFWDGQSSFARSYRDMWLTGFKTACDMLGAVYEIRKEPITMPLEQANTRGTLTYIDAIALRESILALGYDCTLDDTSLRFSFDRYAMDQNGYHVGYERFEGTLPLHSRSAFSLPGLPYGAFPFVVFPSQLDVSEITPAAEETDDEDSYFAPDSDFAFQELDHILSFAIAELPPASFIGDYGTHTRVWECGTYHYSIDSMEEV